MAGEIKLTPTSATTNGVQQRKSRKLWSLQDRSTMSVNLLKANLAEDGCEEAQLDIGKKLFNDSASSRSTNDIIYSRIGCDNSRLAIYWFIKSSEQGNEEATEYLKECYESKKGITCQNLLDVKSCIHTPRNEKLTLKALRQLFSRLCHGEDFITTLQLQARLESCKRNSGSHARFVALDGSGDTCHGFTTDEDEDRQDPDVESSQNISDTEVNFLSKFPSNLANNNTDTITGVKITPEMLMKIGGAYNAGQLIPVPIRDSAFAFPLFRHSWDLLPSIIFWIQFLLICVGFGGVSIQLAACLGIGFLILWSSYNLILWRNRSKIFRDWSNIFKSVLKEECDKDWSNAIPKSKFSKAYFRPYVVTNFLGLCCLLFIDGYDVLKIFIGSLALFSLFVGRILKPFYSQEIFCVYGIQLLTSIPLNPFQYFPIDQSYYLEIMKELLALYLSYHVTVPIPSLTMCLGTIQVILMIHFFYKHRYFAFRRIFPEVVTLFWFLKITDWCLQLSWVEEYNMLIGLSLLLVGLYITIESNLNFKKTLAIVTVAGAILLVSFSGLSQIFTQLVSTANEKNQELSWTTYEQDCHRPAWMIQSVAEAQIFCASKYSGRRVTWTGKLSYVQLHDSSAGDDFTFEMLLDITPPEATEDSNWDWMDLLPILQRQRSPDTGQLSLSPVLIHISTKRVPGNLRGNTIQAILGFRTGDWIEVSGTLVKNLGGFRPEVNDVTSIYCTSCAGDPIVLVEPDRAWILNEFRSPLISVKQFNISEWISFIF